MAAQREREFGVNVKKSKPCRHHFRFMWSSGRGAGGRKIKWPGGKTSRSVAMKFGFRCNHCGEDVERKATPGERKFYAKRVDWARRYGRNKHNIHTIWHEFARRFKKCEKGQDRYRYVGYDLMGRVEKWAEKYPKDVRIAAIDDSYFASSYLVLIEHRTKRSYMGTTAVVIPQCSGEDPLEFFMYPGHQKSLLGALTSIATASKAPRRLERKDEIAESRAIKKNLRHPAIL
jgi:hypothetical protein